MRNIAAGSSDSWIGFFNDAGRFIGGTPDTPAAGTGSGMRELLGVKQVPLTIPDPESVIIDGDDVWLGEFEMESLASRAYIVTLAVYDLQLEAYLLGTNVETIAGGRWGVLDVKNAPERDVCFIHQSRSKKFDGGNKGQKAWQGVLVRGTAKPLGRTAYNSREGAEYRLRIVPALTTHNPWGVTLSTDNAGATEAAQRPFQSDYPYTMQAFTGNNSLAIIPVDHVPAGAQYASAWHGQGLPVAVNSVGTSPNQITVASAFPTDAAATLLYQYQKK